MKWTRELPTQKGYYWHVADWSGTPVIKEVTLWDGVPQVDNGYNHWPVSDDDYKGYWYGPIEPPALPEESNSND